MAVDHQAAPRNLTGVLDDGIGSAHATADDPQQTSREQSVELADIARTDGAGTSGVNALVVGDLLLFESN